MVRIYKDVIRPVIDRKDVKGKYIQTFFRVLKWQVIFRLMKSPVICNIIEDASMIVKRGLSGVTGNLYFGLHEYDDMLFCMHFIKEGEMVYDIGANVGIYTILTAKISKARVIAFEPVERTFRMLSANVAYNGLLNNVICVKKGIGNVSSKIFFTEDLDTFNHAVDENFQGNKVEVDIITLDDFVKEGNEVPVLVKIDTEGFDIPTLEGGDKFFNDKKIRAVVFEIGDAHERLGNSFPYNNMKNRGFTAVSYDGRNRKITVLDENRPCLGNILFVRDLAEATDRLTTARKINVLGDLV